MQQASARRKSFMANTFYVSPIGSDSQSGTLESPFASLEYAHAKAQPGDTILLRGGVYNPLSGIDLKSDGASGKPITIASFPGEHAVLDGSRLPQGDYVINMQDASWNRLVDIEVRDGPEGGIIIRGNSHDNVIEQLDVHHNGGQSEWDGKGISLYGTGGNNLFLNNDSHDNRDLRGDNADGFQISSSGGGNVLRGNRAWGNSDDGFDLFNVQNGTDAGAVLLDGNWAYGNGYDASGNPIGDGNGFKLGGQRADSGSTSGGHLLVNNVAWDNAVGGYAGNNSTEASTLTNNTAYDNGDYNFALREQSNVLSGNLSFGTGRNLISGTTSGDSWTLSTPPDAGDFQSLDDSAARSTRAADGSLQSAGFLQPISGGRMDDIGADTVATAPETTGSATPDPLPPTTTGGTGSVGGTVKGTCGADVLFGSTGDDLIRGGRGDDELHGGAGDDQLRGGAGDDVLFGEGGNDFLLGGCGADTFVFGAGKGGATTTVGDFVPGTDHLQLADGLALASFDTLDVNDDGRSDTALTLSDGSDVHVLGVSGANPWDWLA
ncbi:Hemolysin-type calcium-binding region [Methylorubrum extorquens PA1]|nr:Hemolysin-type calcium-binding region [Methylorubrum extorquens PA1]